MLEQGFVEDAPLLALHGDGALKIDGVPQHDRRDDEIQAARTMTSQFACAIMQFAEPVEAHGASQ
nr:hypothetical protein [Burkholderia pseudomallei]